jgi:hypothetical protein
MQPLNKHDLQQCTRRMPKEVLQLLKTNPRKACVAGGFIRAVIANEKVNDIDIFAANKEHAMEMATALSLDDKLTGDKPRRIITTDNAYTVRGFFIDPQIVHRWTFDDVMDVAGSFDFTIACAIIFWCNRLNQWQGFCDPRFYQDLAAKRLVYRRPVRNEDAGGSMLRVLKFYQRGYRIPLDSLADVMARCVKDVDTGDEEGCARTICDRLVEVDPLIDQSHAAHVPGLMRE